MKVACEAKHQQGINQRRWQYHVSHAQGRKHDFVKATQKNHRRAIVQALKCGYRCSIETILSVVIVFKNVRSRPPCPGKKRQAAINLHCYAHWKLMRGRYEDSLSAIAQLDSL